MFGIGSTELFIIAVFALLIFGPDKIPEIARTISKGVRMFKDAQADMQKVITGEFDLEPPIDEEKKAYYAPGSSTARQEEAARTAAAPKKPAAPASTASEIWSDDDDEEGDEE